MTCVREKLRTCRFFDLSVCDCGAAVNRDGGTGQGGSEGSFLGRLNPSAYSTSM